MYHGRRSEQTYRQAEHPYVYLKKKERENKKKKKTKMAMNVVRMKGLQHLGTSLWQFNCWLQEEFICIPLSPCAVALPPVKVQAEVSRTARHEHYLPICSMNVSVTQQVDSCQSFLCSWNREPYFKLIVFNHCQEETFGRHAYLVPRVFAFSRCSLQIHQRQRVASSFGKVLFITCTHLGAPRGVLGI